MELACFLYSFRDLSAVHVKAQTLPLMGKSAVQVFLIVLSNTLQTLYFPLTPATSFDICLPHYNFLQCTTFTCRIQMARYQYPANGEGCRTSAISLFDSLPGRLCRNNADTALYNCTTVLVPAVKHLLSTLSETSTTEYTVFGHSRL